MHCIYSHIYTTFSDLWGYNKYYISYFSPMCTLYSGFLKKKEENTSKLKFKK